MMGVFEDETGDEHRARKRDETFLRSTESQSGFIEIIPVSIFFALALFTKKTCQCAY